MEAEAQGKALAVTGETGAPGSAQAREGEELSRQPSPEDGQHEVRVSESRTNRGKPARRPKVDRSFVVRAGTLWRGAVSGNDANVSNDQLREIAAALDAAGHLPPSAYLEGKYAQELKVFNSRNSKSKTGPLKTWSQLTSCGDKDLVRGMRRLFSRCAEKLEDDHPVSGN